MKNLIFLTMLFLTLGCSKNNDEKAVSSFEPVTITPVLIGKGASRNHNTLLQSVLIANQTQWSALLNNMNANGNTSNYFTTTNIDFTNFDVVAVFRNDISNGSSSVDITNIVENLNSRIVTVQNLQNGLTQDIATPFHIVKIPKSLKPVLFQ